MSNSPLSVKTLQARLKRNISAFNRNNPNFTFTPQRDIKNRRDLNAVQAAYNKHKAAKRLNQSVNKLIVKAASEGITSIKRPKTKAGVEKLKKKIRDRANFEKQRSKFFNELREHNRTLAASKSRELQNSVLRLNPETKRDLETAKKLLKKSQDGDYEYVKKFLAKHNKKVGTPNHIRFMSDEYTNKRIKERGRGFTYRDRVYYERCVEAARTSVLPQLADLLISGGERIALAFADAGLTINYWIDSDSVIEESDAGFLVSAIQSIVPELPYDLQLLTNEWLKQFKAD